MRRDPARARPFGSWLLGKPDEATRRAALRVRVLLALVVVVANLVGACAVFAIAAFLLPAPPVDDDAEVIVLNLVVAGGYVLVAVAIGAGLGYRAVRRRIGWALEGRTPDEAEQRAVLRIPLVLLGVQAALWAIAVVGFSLFNALLDVDLLTHVGITVLISGAVTCSYAYLLSEFVLRPLAARALATGAPERLFVPGVTLRTVLAFSLGSGLPVLGLMLVALSVLTGREVSATRMAVTVLALGGIVLVVGLFLTLLAARATADPVRGLRAALTRVERGDLEAEVEVYDGTEVGLLQAGFNRMVLGLREREHIRDLFGRHVGEDVARAALERDVELGGEVREVAVLFVDVVGSTKLASERPPQEVVELLNRFFGVVVDVVAEHGGLVNKFEGDGALAVFGAPIPVDDAAGSALAAARCLPSRLADAVPELSAGVGVSAGAAVAGNVGAEARFEYTVIGDPVNEASRLTDAAKDVEGCVLASMAAVEAAGDEEARRWEPGEELALRGRATRTRVARPVR
ncbi:adenylate/guanylate cyclase domain-containing protein [Conexibacter sp. SYSU D00693]|uniref:adenylate/guanylate cyclase domain-containing protein n=1 Tax=Conexibacter sp. SYSU D00693 TaxID=2812560 RepID=UPI003530437B